MKIAISIMMICMFAVTTFAAVPKKASPNAIKKWENFLTDSKVGKYSKITAEVSLKIIKQEVTVNTFNDLKKLVEEHVKKYGYEGQILINRIIVTIAYERFQDYQEICNSEFYETCKMVKSTICYAAIRKINDENKKFALYNDMFSNNIDGKFCSSISFVKAIDDYIKICVKQDENKAKQSLKILNRIVSPFLISNKEGWEPIVAKVRTALESY